MDGKFFGDNAICPDVVFDENMRVLVLKGNCFTTSPELFCTPLLKSIESHKLYIFGKEFRLVCELEYVNISSANEIVVLIKTICKYATQLIIEWMSDDYGGDDANEYIGYIEAELIKQSIFNFRFYTI